MPHKFHLYLINSQLSRLNTARGSGTGLVTVDPSKVIACKSILFTKDVPEVEKKVFLVSYEKYGTLSIYLDMDGVKITTKILKYVILK